MKKTTSISIDQDLLVALKIRAAHEGRTVSNLIEQAIRDWVANVAPVALPRKP